MAGEYTADGTEIKTYAYNPGSPWSTNPLFMKKDEKYYFYINDHLGTPQKIFAENGQTVWEARYTAFGMASVQREIIENNLRFPGQYFDAETGLHYNWHRYYDSETGRYISADPIGLAGGINLYAYVEGDPVNWFDIDGLHPHNGGDDRHPEKIPHPFGPWPSPIGPTDLPDNSPEARKKRSDERRKEVEEFWRGVIESASYATCKCVANCWLGVAQTEIGTTIAKEGGDALAKALLKEKAKSLALKGLAFTGKVSLGISGIQAAYCVVKCNE